jgi:hypothetical protein
MTTMFAPGFHFIAQRREGLHRPLRCGRIVPKIWVFYFCFKFPKP